MISLFKVYCVTSNINTFLKHAFLFVCLSVFGEHVLGQCSVDIGPSATYGCASGSVTLTATLTNPPATPTYSWTGPGGYTSNSASITISNLNVSNAGTYTVSVSGCTNSPITDNITLVVLEYFTITQNNITLCPGQNNINFNPTISGNNSVAPSYSWTGPNNFSSSNANPIINSANSTNAGTYNVTATLGQCSVAVAANVNVLNNLNVSASSNAPLCLGQVLNLSSTVTGNSGQGVSYSWTGPNGFTSTQANPTISNVSSSQSGTYTVTVTSSGCSDNESLTPVILIPSISSGQFSSSTTYGGWLVRCTQSGSNTGAISVSSNIPSSSNVIADTYTINWGDGSPNTVLTSDNWTNQAHTYPLGLYNLNLSIASTMGCTSSQNYSVFVGNQPASPGITLPENAQGCSPMTLTFPISGVSNNVPGTTYTISFSDGSPALTFNQSNIPNSITHTFTSSSCGSSFTNGSITENNAFGVSMQAVNPCGSASASAGPIRTSSPPAISFQLPEYICTNQTALADNTSSPGTNNTGSDCNQNHSFYWNINGSAGWSIGSQNLGSDLGFPQEYDMWASGSDPLSITFNQAGIYTVQLTEKNSCSSQSLTKTICVINPPVCSFSVTPIEGCATLNVSTTNNSIAPACTGVTIPLAYSWVVSTPTNPSFATSTLPQPNFSLTNNGLTALTYTITLTVTPLNPTTNVAISNCASTCVKTVIVYPSPTFTTQPQSPANVCFGGTFNAISVVVNYLGIGTPTYQWYSNITANSAGGTPIPGATSAIYVPLATAVGTIHYYCVVTFPNNANCTQIFSNNVPAIVVPDPIASATPTTQTICVGGTLSNPLTATYANGVGNPSYQWNLAGTPTTAIGGATSSTYTPLAFVSAGTFNYTVTINNSGSGCTANTSAPISVIVIPDPTITSQPIGNTYCQNTPSGNITTLSLNATGGSGTFSYQWFVNTTNSNTGGTAIPSATAASYLPPSNVVGTFYYYCLISQTVTNCNVVSNPAQIIIIASPTFTTQPLITQTICSGGTTSVLNVTTAGGSGNISYQWYSTTTNNNSGGTLIPGATTSSYTPTNTNALLPNTTYYYCVVSYGSGGCSSIYSTTGAVIILPDPVISAQPTATQTICIGGSSAPLTVALQASTGIGAFTYQWYSNTTATNSGGAIISGATAVTYVPPVFNNAGTFYYYCVITDAGNGCGNVTSQVATIVIVVDPTITVQPLPTQTLCQNAAPTALTVTASGGTGTLLYQWYSNSVNSTTSGTLIGSATSATYTPPTATVGSVYYYCVITTVASGCSVTSATAAIIVTQAPNFTTQPTSSNICVGGSPTQMCVTYSNGTGTPFYQWYSNAANNTITGAPIPSANSSCYSPSSSATGTTYYYAIISLTGGGCSSITSNVAALVITPDPVLFTQPIATQSICEGGNSAPLTVAPQAATGIGAFTYQWYLNTTATNSGGTSIGTATNASYAPSVFNTAGTFYYYCIVTDAGNGCGTVTSQVATIVVVVDPTITVQPLLTQTLCQNATPTTLTVTASGGTGTLLYQWYSNSNNNTTSGTLIGSATSATYTPPTTTVGTFYYYCVITTVASGCSVTSAISTVLVNSAPTFTTQPAASNVCIGGATNQMCVAYTNGTGTAAYQWYSNATNITSGGTPIGSATLSCYTPPSLTAGTNYYYAIISLTGGGCSSITSNTAEVIISAGTTLSTQPTPNQTICVGGTIPAPLSVTYAGGAGIPTYQWYSSPSNVAIGGATSTSYTPPTFASAGTNSYYVTVTLPGAGCGVQTSNTANITVIADPTATISSNASYCQNAGNVNQLAVVVTGGNGTPSYQWYSNTTNTNSGGSTITGANAISYSPQIANIGTTYYYCLITQSGTNCAVNSPTSQIVVTPAPTFTTQPAATQSVCEGGATAQLSVAYSNGTGTASYQWYSNTLNTYAGGIAIASAISTFYSPPSTTSGTNYYYCIVSFSAGGGCSMINSNIAEVIVVANPIISTLPLTAQTICVGGTISAALNVAYSGGVGTPNYQWFSLPSSSISGATNSTYTPPTFITPGTYNYYATISLTGSGCEVLTSTNATITVVADPIVSAQPTVTQSVCQNTATSQISVTGNGGNGSATYQWFSNTSNSNIGGTTIAGATLNTYTPPSNAVGTQYYYCLINQSGANCGVTSNPAVVIVNLAPAISVQPLATQQLCLNTATSVLQVVYSNGTGTPSYQWFSNTTNTTLGGNPINNATNNTFTPSSNVAGTFYYYCIVSFDSGGGCPSITSNVSQVIIHPYPTLNITGGQTICLFESSNINFAFTPNSGLYDITISANGQSSVIENFNGSNPVYTVTPSLTTTFIVTNIAYDQVPQCAIQPNTSIIVNVNPLPALNNSNYTFCSDVATTSLQYIPDANTYTYDWLPNTLANYAGQNNGPNVINVTLPDPIGNASTDYYYLSNLTNIATGCQSLDSIKVTINPNPIGSFTLTSTGCIDSPIALSNGNASIGSYEWTIDGILYSSLPNPTPPVFTTLGIHTIEMIAINSYGCADTLNSVIQIYDLPVSNFTTDTASGCAPIPVSFTNLSAGEYVTSYDWTFAPDTVSWNNTFTSASLINPPSVTYLQGDATALYTVSLAVTNACGTVTSSQQITVLPTPMANFTLATHTICSGSTLMVNNISVGEPTGYIWNYGNFTSYNPNLNSMFFPSDSVTHVYPIVLTLPNACGTDTYNDSITVLPDNVQGGFTTSIDAGCSPLTVTLNNTTFDTNLSATWHLDDPANTVIANQNTVQFTYLALSNISQVYNPYLVVTDGCANDTIYSNISVFANPIPNISTSQINICAGSSIDFVGSITGGGIGFDYAWNFGGLGTSNMQNSSFTFANGTSQGLDIPVNLMVSSPTNTGSNCSNSVNTTIHVYSNPTLSQISFNTISGCSDLGVTVSNLPAATNQVNWGDGNINFVNAHTYINHGPGLLSFPVVVTSTSSYSTLPQLICVATSNQIVDVYPTPLPQIFASAINVCEGENIDFIASIANNQNAGISYLWDFGIMGTSSNANTTMSFDVGNATGLQTQVVLTAFQNTSGTICSAAITENVTVYDTPDLTTALYSNVNSCSPLLLSVTNLPTSTYLYNWGDGTTTSNPNHLYLNQGTTPLTYNVSIDATSYYSTLPMLSCNAVANQIVQVNPQPFAAFTFSSDESCMYDPVTTTLQNNSLNAIAPYVWNYGGISHTTNSLNYIATFNTVGAQPVELIVSNQFGCTDSVSHDFIIHELPTVTLNAIDDDFCIGATAEFEIDGTGISTSSWDFGDGTTLNLLNPTTLVHYYSEAGVFSITAIITNIFGCSDTVTFQNEVIIHPTPTASFTASSTTADIVYPYFEFYDLSVGATNYYWNFGDSNWSNDINPTHTYSTEGNYLVELTVTNEYNCFDIATQIVQVEGIVVYIPNAFTPLDYNGVNDTFKPSFSSTEGIEFFEFCIFDRWGKRIFQTNEIDEAWIGNSKEHDSGEDNYYAQNDTYIYTVRYRKKARANDPQPDQIITGHVTIIR